MAELVQAIQDTGASSLRLGYGPEIEASLDAMLPLMPPSSITSRSLALLLLAGDPVSREYITGRVSLATAAELESIRARLEQKLGDVSESIQQVRIAFVERAISGAVLQDGATWKGWSHKLGSLTTHPFWGVVFLAGVLYAIYWFVGVFGAGTLVGLLEENLFGEIINPWFVHLVQKNIPIPLVADFIVGEYGLWTMGMTYALALILPIVTTFFLSFGILEDSGYLPRLAALSNRFFKVLGLNGKAVLPMVLGLGCVTMATLTTRVLDKKRERLLVTLLLALAVPCSAQLGVVMGMLAGISLTATLIWGGAVTLILFAVGWLAARLVPGDRSQLLVELPPLRVPVASNVTLKTLARLEWYLKEVVPLFLVGTAILFLLDKTSLLGMITHLGEPLVSGWLGLPAEASSAFLIGFLRRDFGATGLFLMEAQGLLSPLQVVVAMVTITLFIPCVASVMMIAKERGWKTSAGMVALIIPLAFLIGGILSRALTWIGWGG
jgi:ferrous iron transport protein B